MKFKSIFITVATVSSVAFSVPAFADLLNSGPNVFTFSNLSPFTLLLDVTPTTTDKFSFSFSGTNGIFTLPGFTISTEPLSGTPQTLWNNSLGVISGTKLVDGFKDSTQPSLNLIGGVTYRLTLTGSIAANAPGDHGDVTVQFINATVNNVTPVPEPENYAMMLAGLGLMGVIARRRKNKAD